MSLPAILIVVISSALKVLLFPAYKSTDFDVHRNWLSITHSLPLKLWYFEDTSQWTLDYPPLFAYFEYLLSLIASCIDPVMTQRSSVIVTDLFLYYTSWRLLSTLVVSKAFEGTGSMDHRKSSSQHLSPVLYLFTMLVLNAGLLMVDHIHFQYNGVLLGLLLLCVDLALRGRYLSLAVAFSALVCSKHLFVYLAPPFGIFLLRNYCFSGDRSLKFTAAEVSVGSTGKRSRVGTTEDNAHESAPVVVTGRSFLRFAQLALAALVPVSLAFVPFLLQENGRDQLLQIFRRLFPFGRGLVHAYWAPNIWALYCAGDKALSLLVSKVFRITLSNASAAGLASTSGLTGDFRLLVLPSVPPSVSLLLVLIAQAPAWRRLWLDPHPRSLLPCLVYCSLCAYMLGYHVHEKAILISQVLSVFSALRSKREFEIFSLLSVVGVYSQMPLLFPVYELPTKVFLWIVYSRLALLGSDYFPEKSVGLVGSRLALSALTALLLFCEGLLQLPFASRLPFLPLMLTSISCALFLVYAWYLSFLEVTTAGDPTGFKRD